MLKTRIITALALLPVILGALFCLQGAGWALFVLGVVLLGSWEWTRLARLPAVAGLAFMVSCALLGWCLFRFASGLTVQLIDIVSTVFWCALAPRWLHEKWRLADSALALPLGWLLLLPAGYAMVRLHAVADGPWLLLALMAVAWVADISAYFTGRAFGKHKLAPSISPGKSWEGVVGAYVGMTLYGLILLNSPLTAHLPGYWTFPLLWLLTGISVVGDLLESLFKRQAGIKDSSNLLPGHGGILDRIDSLLAILPVSVALLSLAHLI